MFATDIMKKVSAPPKIRIQIDLPDIAPDSRVYFYGYHVELEWLSDFYTAHRRLDPEDKSYDTLSKASAAIQVFRRQSGIKRLEYEMVLKDYSVPSDAASIPGLRLGDERVPIVAIFSNESTSFKKRPSQERVDRLSEIMGKQPRWWVDYDDPRTYGE